jgi:hypothetical protein
MVAPSSAERTRTQVAPHQLGSLLRASQFRCSSVGEKDAVGEGFTEGGKQVGVRADFHDVSRGSGIHTSVYEIAAASMPLRIGIAISAIVSRPAILARSPRDSCRYPPLQQPQTGVRPVSRLPAERPGDHLPQECALWSYVLWVKRDS